MIAIGCRERWVENTEMIFQPVSPRWAVWQEVLEHRQQIDIVSDESVIHAVARRASGLEQSVAGVCERVDVSPDIVFALTSRILGLESRVAVECHRKAED